MPAQAVNPEPQQALSVQPESSVELTQFIRSICQPHESFYQQSLGLRLPQFNDIAKDEEPFSLDALRRYFYLDEILEASIQELPLNKAQIMQRGELPQAHVGDLVFESMQHRVDALAGQVKAHIQGDEALPLK